MLKLLVIFLFIASKFSEAYTQICPPGGLERNRQGQIDSFSILYPGCTEIDGYFRLLGYEINNLNGLHQLRHIEGALSVYNTAATNLTGLDSIESAGSLTISANFNLMNIDAVSQIENLEKLTIEGNTLLTDYSGLSSLKVVNSVVLGQIPITNLTFLPPALSITNLELGQLSKLESLEGFPHGENFLEGIQNISVIVCPMLNNINALLGIEKLEILEVSSNNHLTSFAGLDSLKEINSLRIIGNDKLESISALHKLTKIHDLIIGGNLLLSNLHGLESITSIRNIILQNSKLTSLEGLNQLRVVEENAQFEYGGFEDLTALDLDSVYGNLYLHKNYELKNLDGLQSLKYVGGSFNIYENPKLLTLAHLDSLNYVHSLYVQYNVKLESIIGFKALHEIPGLFIIRGNSSLVDISGLFSLEKVGRFQLDGTSLTSLEGLESLDTIYNNLEISNNPILADANSLHDLQYVGNFLLNQNASLASLPVFESMHAIGGNLTITNNESLQSVAAFQNLEYIHGFLTITGNVLLPSLEGLDNIGWWSIYNFILKDNPSLMMCVTPGICQYLAQEEKPRTISNNGNGCQSSEEIEDLCGPLSTNGVNEKSVTLYPNPTMSSVYLTSEYVINSITIHDVNGLPLIKLNHPNDEIDISLYPAGIYFIQIEMDAGVVMKRMVKN